MNAISTPTERKTANAAWGEAREVKLSILIPFFLDDPSALAAGLNPMIGARKDIEIVLFDDGTPSLALNSDVARCVRALSAPARLVSSDVNLGRASARNRLARAARGEWLLYLDADMAPAGDAFLDAYLEAVDGDGFDAAFGGFETDAPAEHAHRVHAALTRLSDEHDAAARLRTGATAFCASNMLVRAEVMKAVPFDEDFTGWGYEDVEWAVRADKAFTLTHLDNAARHGGLESVEGLLRRFRAGAENYRRLLDKHPELAALPGARVARTIGAAPFPGTLREAFAKLARSRFCPIRLRVMALKLWRASWTAEALR
jgi:glycosyltransferase involved in cell wall biosynthesis